MKPFEPDELSAAEQAARHFVEHEREFQLGALPTEQPHPRTVGLAETAQQSMRKGVQRLQRVDQDIPPAAQRAFREEAFQRLRAAITHAVMRRKTVYLSGCGATGRVSLLLEAAWRRFWRRLEADAPHVAARFPNAREQVHGMITGGDYALVRSVESFEDYLSFGRHQIAEAGVQANDVVVAITEGGETSSVIGTAWQGLDAGAKVFFICNNPRDILERHVARSREILSHPQVTHLNLASGPMAVAGSTRMQATTSEILVVGAAMELALSDLLHEYLSDAGRQRYGLVQEPEMYVRRFTALLDALSAPPAVETIAAVAELEARTFAQGGAVTYAGNDYMLDIFTDTTERAPTFMIPPFRRADDVESPRSWAFVKHLFLDTPEAWKDVLQRTPRCLEWTSETYAQLGAAGKIRHAPPHVSLEDMFQFRVGREADPSRHQAATDLATLVLVGAETGVTAQHALLQPFLEAMKAFPHRAALLIGPQSLSSPSAEHAFHVPVDAPTSPLALWDHLAVKLVLNTLSTATMARMGRVVSNLMVFVEATNKKLIDRGTRLISALTGLGYEDACVALHQTMAELANRPRDRTEAPSPVATTIERMGQTRA